MNESGELSLSESDLSKITLELVKLEERARVSQEAIRNFAKEAHIALGENKDTAPAIANLEPKIEAAETTLSRFQAKTAKMDAIGASDKAWASIEYDIGLAADEAERLQGELDALSKNGGIDETQYESLSQRLQDAIEGFNALTGAADETETETRRIPPVIRGIGTAFSIPLRAFGALASSAGRLGTALAKITGAGFLSFMHTFAASTGEAARNLTKLTATAVSSGVKRLGAWLSNAARSMLLFGRQSKRSNSILKKSFATILKYGLGVRSFYYLFRKIRQAISEGYQNLARYSDTLNTSISDVISSFKRFENQFAASFAPLVNTVAPAVATLIDNLTEATYRAGQFIAVLSGQKTVIRAKEVQENFAASLEETKKAAKDAKNQLAGFDKLEILQEKDEHTKPEDMFETVPVEDEAKQFADDFRDAWVNVDLSGIGEIVGGKIKVALDNIQWPDIQQGAANLGKRLATFLNGLINVPGLGKSLGKSIAEAINTAFAFLDGFVWRFDWKDLGNAIMDTVEAACDNLDWELINHALQGLALGLANLLNTIFSRVEVWEKIGVTIGRGINAAVNAGVTFLEEFDFNQAARAIVTGLNAAIAEIAWEEIGRLLADLFGGALQFIRTALLEFHWVELGEDFADGLNEFVQVMLDKILHFEWDKIGQGIADGVNAAVGRIGWNSLGTLIGRLIGGALKLAASFIRGLDYAEIMQSIEDFFSSALRRIDYYDLLTVWGVAALIVAVKRLIAAHPVLALISAAVLALGPKLGSTIQKMINDIQWADVGKTIGDSLIWVIGRLNEAVARADWYAIAESLFKGLTEMILNIDWGRIIEALGELLINSLRASVDILLGAIAGIFAGIGEALEEAGHDVVGGFFKGIEEKLKGAAQWLREHFFDPVLNAWKSLWGINSPSKVMMEQGGFIVEGLFNGIAAAWHIITDFFGDALEGLKTMLGGAWKTISGAASTAWNGISTTLSGIVGGITSNIGGAWDAIKTGASGKLSEVAKTVSGKWNDMKTTASTAWDGLKKTVDNTISGVKQSAIGKVSEIVNETKEKWDRIKSDALSGWSNVKSAIVPKAQEIRSGVVSAFQSMQGTLSGVWNGIRSAASGALSSVSATVSSMVSSISSRVSSIRSTVSNITSSASDALSKVADKMDDLTKKSANNVVKVGGLASGGFVTDGGHIRSWYDSVRKYASGTSRAMGSLFVAGESGPEIVGHVNGRTEVLNESQIAGAIYSAVLAAMGEAVKTLGGFLSQQMATNTNALITAIGQTQGPAPIEISPDSSALLERLSALSATPYQAPAYAGGTVMPYEITAEIRRSTDKITGCIDSNTEELIRAMIAAFASQTATFSSALTALGELGGGQRGSSFNDLKDAANTWTQMYGQSPFFA